MESDDRVTFVISHLDDALAELDKMDSMIGMYKSQLSVRMPTVSSNFRFSLILGLFITSC